MKWEFPDAETIKLAIKTSQLINQIGVKNATQSTNKSKTRRKNIFTNSNARKKHQRNSRTATRRSQLEPVRSQQCDTLIILTPEKIEKLLISRMKLQSQSAEKNKTSVK